jgi:hypothetical protein
MSVAFQVDGIAEFTKSLQAFAKAAERDVVNHTKGLAYRITYNLVMETPQYSGAAASAWRVGLGSPEYITDKPSFKVSDIGIMEPGLREPYSKKDRNMKAVNEALVLCGFEIGMFHLAHGSIYITNGLEYTQWFESEQYMAGKALRQVNLPHRGVNAVVLDSLNASSVLRF